MKKDLLDSVYAQLKSAVSATTKSDIYYNVLPNEELLKSFTVVYTVSNSNNTDTFNAKEVNKNYVLTVQINNPTADKIISNAVFIKSKVYQLPDLNSSIKCVNEIDEDLFYDFDLKLNTGYLKFNLQYAG